MAPTILIPPSDDQYFAQALGEYREASGDTREFAELPNDVQHTILQRAHQLKQRADEEKRG